MAKILLIKTSSLGDVVHNLPVVSDICKYIPDAHIDWVVEQPFADIPALHPQVRQVIPVAIRRWRKKPLNNETLKEITHFRSTLKSVYYDHIIDTQGLLKSAILARLACGKRHGQDWRSAREKGASLFYQYKHHVPRSQHAVTRNRQLAALALGYATPENPPDYGLHTFSAQPPIQEPYVVFLHGTSRAAKLWRDDYWITLGDELNRHNLKIVLTWGNQEEKTRGEKFNEFIEHSALLPRMPIKQLAGVLKNARAAVGVDTGLAHLAVALNVPTVAIYTDTNPVLTGVYGTNAEYTANLGGKNQMPEPKIVLGKLEKMGVI